MEIDRLIGEYKALMESKLVEPFPVDDADLDHVVR